MKINCFTKSLMFCSKVSFDKNSFVSAIKTSRTRKRGVRVSAGFRDGLRKFLDDIAFENWAPRSSRTWRLSLPPKQSTQQNQTESASNQERGSHSFRDLLIHFQQRPCGIHWSKRSRRNWRIQSRC